MQRTDVYDIIKSPEISKFLRENDCMDIFGKEQIILRSYIPAEQKVEMLKKLWVSGDKEESRLIYEVYSIYKSCMADIGPSCGENHFRIGRCQTLSEGWQYLERVSCL